MVGAHRRSTTSLSKRTGASHRTIVGAVAGTIRELFHRGTAKFAAVYNETVVGSVYTALAPYKQLAGQLRESEKFQKQYHSLTSLSRSLNRKFVARIEEHNLVGRVATPFTPSSVLPSSTSSSNRSLVTRIPEFGEANFCNDDFCFECVFIENVVNEILDLVCAVIENFDADIVEPDENFCNLTDYVISGTKPQISDLLDIFSTDGFAPGELDARIPFDEFPGTWVDAAQTAVFGEDNDIRAAALRAVEFVTVFDPDDPGSIAFYGKFLTTCDVVEHARCDRGIQGLGFWPGLVTVLFIYVTALIVTLLWFSPGASLLVAFLPILPLVWWVSAYAISPRCLVPSPGAFVLPFPLNAFAALPITPECVTNDVYCSLRIFEGECAEFWGGLVLDPTCPNDQQDFTREFFECSDEPFNFDNIFRNFFYLLERFIPEVNDFLRTTNQLLFSWIRQIPIFEEALTFPEGIEFTSEDTFHACNINTILNLPASVLFIVLASMLTFASIAALWIIVVILWRAVYEILFLPLHLLLPLLVPVVPPKDMLPWYPDKEIDEEGEDPRLSEFLWGHEKKLI